MRIAEAVESDVALYLNQIKEDPKLLLSTDPIVPPPDETIIQQTYKLLASSWMMGMLHASPQSFEFADDNVINEILSSLDEIFVFEEALQRASMRAALTSDEFKDLSNHLKNQAYTIGRLTQLDMVEKAREHYLKQFTESGASLESYVNSIDYDDLTEKVGLPGYYETVYRTNIQNDYNAARAMQFQSNPPSYLEFIGIEDARQTSICKIRSGIVLPYTDPWWRENWPPLHYNCRSTIRGIYKSEAKSKNLVAKEVRKMSSPYMAQAAEAQHGFGKNPIYDNQFWKGTAAEQAKIIKNLIQEEINGVAGKTVAEDFSRPKEGYIYNNPENGKGGVRYPKGFLEKEAGQGAQSNLDIAKIVAGDSGRFIELREKQRLDSNRSFDAWINGVECWEFKDFIDAERVTMSSEIRRAATQGSNLAVRLHHEGQIDTLYKALKGRVPGLIEIGRKINEMIVIYKDKLISLSWDILQDEKAVLNSLTALR